MDIPVSKVRKVLKIAQEPSPLNPDRRGGDSHLGDFIEDRPAFSGRSGYHLT